jgi:hypothetical protein
MQSRAAGSEGELAWLQRSTSERSRVAFTGHKGRYLQAIVVSCSDGGWLRVLLFAVTWLCLHRQDDLLTRRCKCLTHILLHREIP